MSKLTLIEGDLTKEKHTLALVRLINSYMDDAMGGAASSISDKMASQLICGLQSHPTAVILFCELNSLLIGLSVAFVGFSTFYAKPLLNIHDLIVLPEYRHNGAGRLLMSGCIAKAKSLDCCKVTLEVREDNVKAKNLYSSFGLSKGEHPMEFWKMVLN